MSRLHTPVDGTLFLGMHRPFPREETHIFPLPEVKQVAQSADAGGAEADPFGPEDFLPRWWPGQGFNQ